MENRAITYSRMTERNLPCSVHADRMFHGKHEQYYYQLQRLEDLIEDGKLVFVGNFPDTSENNFLKLNDVEVDWDQLNDLFKGDL